MRHRSKTFLGGTVWSSCSDFKIHLVTCGGLRNSSWDFGLRSLQSHAARAPETRITKFYTNENNKKLKRCLIQSITLFSRSSRLRPKMFPCLFILVLMRFQYFQCALDIQLLVSVNKAESSRIHWFCFWKPQFWQHSLRLPLGHKLYSFGRKALKTFCVLDTLQFLWQSTIHNVTDNWRHASRNSQKDKYVTWHLAVVRLYEFCYIQSGVFFIY